MTLDVLKHIPTGQRYVNLFKNSVLEPLGISNLGLRDIIRKLMDVPANVDKVFPNISLLFPAIHFYTVDMLS